MHSRITFVCVFLTIFPSSIISSSTTPPLAVQCYSLQSEFKEACTRDAGGVTEGGRCYFVAGLASSWTDKWSMCRKYGGIVAHIHSDSEFKIVTTYLQAKSQWPRIGFATLAARDTNHSTSGGEPSVQQTVFWYDSENELNPQLNTTSTWIRTHVDDDWSRNAPTNAPRCLNMWYNNKVSDDSCSQYSVVLCQITSKNQNFTITNFCLLETPVEEFCANGPDQCGRVCSSRPWCRSFNFIINTGGDAGDALYKCQLFPWSINDNCPLCANRTSSNESCYLYNYVI